MYIYKYYDYLIKSDIELLNFVSAEFDIGLRIISVHYINASPKTYIRDPALHYVCYEDVVFELKIAEMTINIVSLDSLCFQEVFRNRPFAMFCSLDKRLVLHASAIESGGNVFGFCGPKGAGKTTLALYLSNCFKLFTDDQLCLFLETNDVYTISPDNIQKITKNTADVLSLNNHCGHYHPQYQKYIYHSNNYTNNSINMLKAVFFLRRSEKNNFAIKQINDFSHKVALIISNTVGKQSSCDTIVCGDLIEKIARLDMYYLYYKGIDFCGDSIIECISNISKQKVGSKSENKTLERK